MTPRKQVDKGKAPMLEDNEGRRMIRSRAAGVVICEAHDEAPKRERNGRQVDALRRAPEEATPEGFKEPNIEKEPEQEEAGQPEVVMGPRTMEMARPDIPGPSGGSGTAPPTQGALQENSVVMSILLGISQTLQELLQAQRRTIETLVPQPRPRETKPVVQLPFGRAEARAVDPPMQIQPDLELNMKVFHSMKPPTFTGEGDYRVVDAWLDGMEKVFAYMRCPERHKVPYVVYKLEGDVERCWRAERQTLPNEGIDLSWANFRVRFTCYYVPSSERARRASEFLSLFQGKRTVEEYNAQFRALARFVPWAQADVVETTQKFQDGLRPSIRRNIAPLLLTRYEDILDRARVVDREEEDLTRIRERKQVARDTEQGRRQRPRGS